MLYEKMFFNDNVFFTKTSKKQHPSLLMCIFHRSHAVIYNTMQRSSLRAYVLAFKNPTKSHVKSSETFTFYMFLLFCVMLTASADVILRCYSCMLILA